MDMEKLVKYEVGFRVVSLPMEVKLHKEELIRYIAVSLGLISPKESRQKFLAVFGKLLEGFIKGKHYTIEELKEETGLEEKIIYYHLKKLKERGLITKQNNAYTIGDGFEINFIKILRKSYEEKMGEMLEKVEEAFNSLKSQV